MTYMNNNTNIEKEKRYLWKMIDDYSFFALTDSELNGGNKFKNDPDFIRQYIKNNRFENEYGDPQSIIYNGHFGWSIPNEKAITEIIKFVKTDSILEIGSGMGLWSYILQLYSVVVYPTDNYSYGVHRWGYLFTNVEKIDNFQALEKYKNVNVLMLIWPDLTNMAYDTLEAFKGNKLIFIGEFREDASNATPGFYFQVKKKWKLCKKIELKRFFAHYDDAFLFIRK